MSTITEEAKATSLDNILGTLKRNAPAKSTSGKTYPVLPDVDNTVAEAVNKIHECAEYADAMKGAKKGLTAIAASFFNQINSGKGDPASGIIAKGTDREVLISFSSYYGGVTDPAELESVASGLSNHFERKYSITIKGDELPKQNEENLLADLIELFNRYGATDALEVKDSHVPKAGFHKSRHTILDEAENNRLDEIIRSRIAIKTKGRK